MISSLITLKPLPKLQSSSNITPVILPFTQSIHPKKVNTKPCIFCGLKQKTRTFKGKAVCLSCLKSIPFIFNCG